MKILMLCLLFFILSACSTSDDSSAQGGESDDPSAQGEESDDPSAQGGESDDPSAQKYKYNVACQCKGLEEIGEPITANSSKNEADAQLLAGTLCVALRPEKEILKKENLSVAEISKIESIMQQTLDKFLSDNADESVLNEVYDCVPN